VPVLSFLAGEVVAGLIWLSCSLGALGSSLIALDGAQAQAAATASAAAAKHAAASLAHAPSEQAASAAAAARHAADAAGVDTLLGQWLTLGACLFFALSTVRIGCYSKRFRGPELAFAIQAAGAAMALVWLAVDVATSPRGVHAEMQHIALVFRNHTAVAVLLWIGLGPGAAAALLQMWGQRLVPAAQAQVVFSSTPLWAGIIAQNVLQGETMGVQGWLGSSVIVLATLLAAFGDLGGGSGGPVPAASGDKGGGSGGKL
jgi:drug/metabolite transporter (DMT)-like permease